MLILSEFRHAHHPPRVKMLAKFIRRGFSVFYFFVLQFQYWVLRFLAGRKVGFALEIWEEKSVHGDSS